LAQGFDLFGLQAVPGGQAADGHTNEYLETVAIVASQAVAAAKVKHNSAGLVRQPDSRCSKVRHQWVI